MDINTCYETTNTFHTVAYYTHFVPIIVSALLSIYLLFKTKFSLLSKIFFVFVLAMNFWLLADIVAWTSNDYNLIQFFWSFFDYINVVFFLLGLYFFMVLVKQRDIDWKLKFIGLLLVAPAFQRIITGNSIHEFDHTFCESLNDDFLVAYKNYVEMFVIVVILTITGFVWFRRGADKVKRNQVAFTALGLVLFFVTFSATDYVATSLGQYYIGLYGLFVLPVFLGLIVYSIVRYRAFNIGILGAQALVATLVALVGSQFFFIQTLTSRVLNSVTFILVLFFGYLLVKSVKREVEARKYLEKLTYDLGVANARLKELDKQKTEFVSFATHQLRSPLTAMKGYSSLILEGDYGEISTDLRGAIEKIHESSNTLTTVVNDYLNISRIELGSMKYDLKPTDLKELVKEVIGELQLNIDKAGIKFSFELDARQKYLAKIDLDKFKQVIANIIDNSIKYTPTGSIVASLKKDAQKSTILFAIKDTGIGMAQGVIPKLFAKFSRAENANAVNIRGTGLGLYVAKEIVRAHGGKVWAESEGEGKGSQFYVELPADK